MRQISANVKVQLMNSNYAMNDELNEKYKLLTLILLGWRGGMWALRTPPVVFLNNFRMGRAFDLKFCDFS